MFCFGFFVLSLGFLLLGLLGAFCLSACLWVFVFCLFVGVLVVVVWFGLGFWFLLLLLLLFRSNLQVRSGPIDLLLVTCNPVLPASGSSRGRLNRHLHHFSQGKLWGGWLDTQMDVRARSVKGRRFWTASGGHLPIIPVALQLPFFRNGFSSKLLWSPQGSLSLYSTSFWQLLRRRWCQTVMALLFLWIHHRRGEGGGLHGQQPGLQIAQPRLTSIQSPTPASTPGEDTPASPPAWTQHGEQQIRVTCHRSIGVEHGARGCSRRWERSSDLTGQLSPASSWAAPSQ